MKRPFVGPSAVLLAALCLTRCADEIHPSRHFLDTGDVDAQQWVPTGRAMQALTPRAVDLLGPQCTLMRFDWFYLEEDLAALSSCEVDGLRQRVEAGLGALPCGTQRHVYGLLATAPEQHRESLVQHAEVWCSARDGHSLRPETLSHFDPAARWPAVQVAAHCPDFEAYLEDVQPASLSSRQWLRIQQALEGGLGQGPPRGGDACACRQAFSGGVNFFPPPPH